MICIKCFHEKTSITNSRKSKKQPSVWRRHFCPSCKTTFTTYESPSLHEIQVINIAGQSRTFNLGALIQSIARAFSHNSDMALYDSYEIAKTIEVACISSINNGILTTDQIRQHAHTTLHRYDPVAALQYGAQHGMIMSARRQRGRPSTIATSDGDAARG